MVFVHTGLNSPIKVMNEWDIGAEERHTGVYNNSLPHISLGNIDFEKHSKEMWH